MDDDHFYNDDNDDDDGEDGDDDDITPENTMLPTNRMHEISKKMKLKLILNLKCSQSSKFFIDSNLSFQVLRKMKYAKNK